MNATDRSGFLRVTGAGVCLAVLALAGCGPKGLSAEAAKEACFSNQVKIRDMENLFNADSGQFAPVSDVATKLGATCPSGGKYTFDTAADKVTCSIHGAAPQQK